MTITTPIQTSLTKLLGIKTPIVEAAMAGASGGLLAAQVSLAGGFGFLSAGYDSVENLEKEINIARSLLQPNGDILPIGVGFLCWQLEKLPDKAEKLLTVALENRVQAVWFAFGNDIGRWVNFVRENDPRAHTKDAVKIFIQVSTVPDLRLALDTWKADVIVAQGNEAGGHGLSTSLTTLTLLPLFAQVVAESNGPPLLAAGGLATGSQIASLLTLGASGVVLGTRFLLSPESLYTDVQRTALVEADSFKSVRTMAFDYARNTLGWPEGIDGRGLRNATVDDYEKGEDMEIIRKKFAEGVRMNDTSRSVVWAGSAVGLMSKIIPAREILLELHEECLQCLKNTSNLISK
ncbi:Nitronate monooxygenase [Psilocybe cubensis]|uniref:Nitronate monooxygenase n=2 Tax=Psilocybe cubensis TaxID=181762 RepID=A0ACB8GVX9_PSICU|nr:Nitronate monooxygenase [Psilocybe cubensis]KAH9479624.1 Nitronate monooxygenase [Psilocybe cubensis]